MESADEGLENIFGDHESRENEGETNGIGDETSAVRIQPPKRVVKNPRLKFNPERLCGKRGIPILVDHFKNVKFKGKGYEKEDLDTLLTKLEHWTHRLFPSMKFEDCLHHVEKLGRKRPVQTCLRKIRLDMPILDTDFVKDDDDEEDDVERNEDNVQRNEDVDPVEMDAFDRLVGENPNVNPPTTVDSEMGSVLSMFSSPSQRVPTYESGHILGSAGSSLTEEQRERLERNRLLAIERRKARFASIQQNATESLSENNEETSQRDSVILSLESPKRGTMIISDDFSASSSHSHNNENDKIIPSELSDKNSDNLGLDDLIALVDREEVDSEKITNTFYEQSTEICVETTEKLSKVSMLSNLKQTTSCSASGDENNSSLTTSKTLESNETDNLELDSLMDLIDDNSKEHQPHSDSLETVRHESHSKNLISGEEISSAMDYEEEKSLKYFGPDSPTLVIVEDPLED